MSYSRWGEDSRWYTYWCVQDPETENRDTSFFTVAGTCGFMAKDIRGDIENCLNIAVMNEGDGVTEKERDHLKDCMKRFLKNVDRVYPEEE